MSEPALSMHHVAASATISDRMKPALQFLTICSLILENFSRNADRILEVNRTHITYDRTYEIDFTTCANSCSLSCLRSPYDLQHRTPITNRTPLSIGCHHSLTHETPLIWL